MPLPAANPLDGVDIWPLLSGQQTDVTREDERAMLDALVQIQTRQASFHCVLLRSSATVLPLS